MGYKAYEKAAEKTTDASQKAVYLDSMLTIYQLKANQFGLTDREQNNLAYRYYKYFRTDKSRYEEALNTFETVFASPDKVILSNMPAYMSIIRQYSTQVKPLSATELMEVRATIARAEAEKRKAGVEAAKLKRLTNLVDQLFYETIKPMLSCEVIEELTSPEKLEQFDFARMVFAWSMEFSCTSFDFFELAAKSIANHPEGRNAGILVLIAKKAAADGRYDEALSYYQESLPLWTETEKKANTYMDMAKVYVLKKDKATARKSAFKAAETDDQLKAGAYSFVANLYMGSFNDCDEGYSVTEDRAVFMAAYDLFQKAGDIEGMEAARAQFPTRSQAHTGNYADGDVIDIGCWINVKTKVKTRSSQ